MTRSRVDAGGHLAVPQEVLAALMLSDGDIVEFVPHDGGRYLLVPRNREVSDLKGMFVHSRALTTDEMGEAVASEAVKGNLAGGSHSDERDA